MAQVINSLIGLASVHGNYPGAVLGGLTAVGRGPLRKLRSSIVFDPEELTPEQRRQLMQMSLSLDFPQSQWALRYAIFSRLQAMNLREREISRSYGRLSNEQRKLFALGLIYRSTTADVWEKKAVMGKVRHILWVLKEQYLPPLMRPYPPGEDIALASALDGLRTLMNEALSPDFVNAHILTAGPKRGPCYNLFEKIYH